MILASKWPENQTKRPGELPGRFVEGERARMSQQRDQVRPSRTAPTLRGFVAVAGLILLLSTPAQGLNRQHRAPQVVIYLERLTLTGTIADVALDAVSLTGSAGERPLAFVAGALTANRSSDTQLRLVDEEIPPGRYQARRVSAAGLCLFPWRCSWES